MGQGTVIIIALGAVLLIAAASVILLGRNAARTGQSAMTDDATSSTASPPSDAAQVEGTAGSARVATLEKVSEDDLGLSRRQFMNRSIYALLGLAVLPAFLTSLLAFLIPSGKGGFGGLVHVTTPLTDIVSQINDLKTVLHS